MGRQSGRTRSGSTGPPPVANRFGAAANGERRTANGEQRTANSERRTALSQRRRGAEAQRRAVGGCGVVSKISFLGNCNTLFGTSLCASAIRCCCCRSSGASARFAFRSVAQTPRVLPDKRTANCFVAETQRRRGVLSASAEPFPKSFLGEQQRSVRHEPLRPLRLRDSLLLLPFLK